MNKYGWSICSPFLLGMYHNGFLSTLFQLFLVQRYSHEEVSKTQADFCNYYSEGPALRFHEQLSGKLF